MKRILYLLLISALLFTSSACADSGGLTKETREKVMQAVIFSTEDDEAMDLKKPGEGNLIFDAGNSIRYLGVYMGYTAVFHEGNTFGMGYYHIGEETFLYRQGFVIYLYRNGERYSLEDAYKEGRINDKNLRKLAARYYWDIFGAYGPDYSGWGTRVPEGWYEAKSMYKDVKISDDILTEEEKQMLMQDILYARAKDRGLDIQSPGKGHQIFADAPYYYLATCKDTYAVTCFYNFSSDYSLELEIGEEVFRFQGGQTSIHICGGAENEFLTVEEAYSRGLIDEAKLREIAKAFYQFCLSEAEDPEQVRQLYGEYAERYE